MSIGLIGMGAIGGTVATCVQSRRGDVVVAAGRHAEALRGARLEVCGTPCKLSADEAPPIHETLPRLGQPYELILLCTRTIDIETALAPAVPLLAPDGAVVCLQNGLPEERVAALVGRERVLGAVIGWSASTVEPGKYIITGGGAFTLVGASPRLDFAREVLSVTPFPVRITRNLAGARWSKLALNCAISTLGAVSGLTLGELAARREVRRLALRIVAEVVEKAQARGVRMEPVSGIRPDRLVRASPFIGHAAIWLAARKRPRQKTGMIARLEEGKTAGVEDLNALIDGPVNRKLVEMVREIEQGKRRISPQNLAELA
ncbi:MAG: ketopantoate reductase family protein [Myxococcales bacterium]